MKLVLIFWTILAIIVIAYMYMIIRCVRNGEIARKDEIYSDEVIERTEIIINAIKTGMIKKHIISNSAKKYDSKKALEDYKIFLRSDLMTDLMLLDEENYNG